MFIDTHCHLTREFVKDTGLDDIVKRGFDANVGKMICSGADVSDVPQIMEIIEKYDNIYGTLGLHPECANNDTIDVESILKPELFAHPKIVGVGEIGLDYHYGIEHKNKQFELFSTQLHIAKTVNLPVAIHSRDAEADTMQFLDGSVRGVLHSFTSSWDMAKILLDRGFYFSANGILTFKNADALRETFAKIPMDRIVIETDAPYLAPVPYRGKTCEPFMVSRVPEILSEIKNMDISDVEKALFDNTIALYPKLGAK